MKKYLSFVLSVLMCFTLVSCADNAADAHPENTDGNIADVSRQNDSQSVPHVQDFISFLDGKKPYYDKVLTDDDGSCFRAANYTLALGEEALIEQYIHTITSSGYNLSLSDVATSDTNWATYTYYYIKYDGDKNGYFGTWDEDYHINISVGKHKYETTSEITFGFADGFEYVDDGHRADFSKVIYLPALSPTPAPTLSPTISPTASPTQPPVTKPVTPVQTVDKNSTVIPDFNAFMNRSPSEDKDRYYGGNRKYYQKIPLDTQRTVVSEVLALLNNNRYQLELIEKVEDDDRIEYNYRYTGNAAMDMIHSKNDDTRYYNLQFTIYNRNNDNGTYGIHFHYSPQFTEENPGYTVSESVHSGIGGGGGTTDFDRNDLPDHSKLQCLTCDGTGDCKRCGGSTYVGFGDARAKCDACRGTGNCRTCGGSGTRN